MATTTVDSQSSLPDTIKLIIAVLLVILSLGGFYYFSESSLLYRVLGLLAVVIAASAIAFTTTRGKNLVAFMGGARMEVRKMVWPTRVETMQTTLIVIVMVALLAVVLLIVDSILGWLVKLFLGTGG
ncbi:MAG TPA: preprotein translocase subunit SecE [Thiothrix sp.]|nr:preprotein translocase subunit SecE [Thiothrix sp.]